MEYFITGIDTDIGKTFVTIGLALASESKGLKAGVYKPLQSGAIRQGDKLLAPDIEAVKKYSDKINTKYSYLLEGEVSPALAAKLSGVNIDANKILTDFKEFSKINEITFVEGAGGILAPAFDNMLCADLIKLLNIPVIIVTTPFLGRLNHTLLTVYYAKQNNIPIKGIIINRTPENTNDLASKNFIKELQSYTDTKIIGCIKDIKKPDKQRMIEEFTKIIL